VPCILRLTGVNLASFLAKRVDVFASFGHFSQKLGDFVHKTSGHSAPHALQFLTSHHSTIFSGMNEHKRASS